MQEVKSLPQTNNRNWASWLVFGICFAGITTSLVNQNVTTFSTSIALFAGWLITVGVTQFYFRVTTSAVIIACLSGSIVDAMTFAIPWTERGLHHIRWEKVLAYTIAGCAGACFGLFRTNGK